MEKVKVEQRVWYTKAKKKAVVKELLNNGLIRITYFDRKTDKRQIKDVLREELKPLKKRRKRDVVYFAKVRPEAVIPSKRREDAGYDFYACFQENELRLVKGKPNLIPTGIASAMSSKYYLNLKHERGSTGKYGMSVLSGVVDSGFRNEIFINICPTYKDVIISKTYDFPTENGKPKAVELDDVIYYPYSLAIAQGTIEYVPNVYIKEIPYERLEKIPSKRGKSMLGQSGK